MEIICPEEAQSLFLSIAQRSTKYSKHPKKKEQSPPSYDCVLCQQQLEETLQHLFLSCPFTIGCWGFLHLAITTAEPFGALQSLKAQLDMDFFMDIIIILSWTIWMAQNDFIFKGSPHHLRKHKKGSKRNLF
jgi:hypothetical protein